MGKPKFFRTELIEVEGDVFDYLYPKYKGKSDQFTLKERLGNDDARCTSCNNNTWVIQPKLLCDSGKPYIQCMSCGNITHL